MARLGVKLGSQENLDEAGSLLDRVLAGAQRNHVRIIVLPGQLRGGVIPRERSSHANNLVRRDLLAVSRTADDDAERARIRHNRLAGSKADRRVGVELVIRVVAVVHHLVARARQMLHKVRFQFKSGVICRYVYSHVSQHILSPRLSFDLHEVTTLVGQLVAHSYGTGRLALMTEIDATTQEVIDGLDSSIRPQDDLFRHVNGKWLAETEIPSDQASAGSFIDLRNQAEKDVLAIIEELGDEPTDDEARKIVALYKSFMNEEEVDGRGAGPLGQDFQLIADATTKDELAVAIGGLGTTGVAAPYALMIDQDRNDPQRNIVWMAQDGLGLPDESFYREEQYAEILEAYKNFIPELYALGKEVDDVAANAAAEAIVSFETAIASHHFTAVELRDAEKTNNLMSVAELADSAPGFNWAASLEAQGVSAENAPEILVMTPSALTGFAAEWEKAELEDLKTYLYWHIIVSRAPYLSTPIAQANFNFYGKVLSGAEVQRDRWKRGVGFVNGAIGEAVGKIYVEKHFPPRAKEQMLQLVEDLLEAYRQSISELDWMSEETRPKALAKLEKFVTKIGYPDKWRDYSALEVSPDDLLGNVRAANRYEHNRAINKLGEPVDLTEWYMTPQTVNAYYNPTSNEIAFPAAILQPPFFDPDADAAWNYGGIGAVIGHEIGHGFDDQGSKYDGDGKLNNWWTDTDRTEFEKRTGSLVDQYNAYVPAQFGEDSPHHVNGELTLGENIGDLGGLSIGLKAYDIACKRDGLSGSEEAPVIAGYTGVQRVLLSYARIWQEKRRDELMVQRVATDPHAPAEFRSNGVVKNVDAFADAFNVAEGDALYLPADERVRIW